MKPPSHKDPDVTIIENPAGYVPTGDKKIAKSKCSPTTCVWWLLTMCVLVAMGCEHVEAADAFNLQYSDEPTIPHGAVLNKGMGLKPL